MAGQIPIPPPVANLQGGAPLSGSVIGDDGKPIQAVVTALKVGLPVASGRTTSANDGSFALSGIPDGQYQLCAADTGGNYLNPCTWSATPVTVTISAAKPVTGYKLILARGVVLQVKLNDSGLLLDSPVSALNQAPATLVVGVVTPRHTLQSLPMIAKNSVGRTHQAAVPANTAINLSLFGAGFSLTDVSGKALDIAHGTVIPIQTGTGQPIPPLVFAVGAAKAAGK